MVAKLESEGKNASLTFEQQEVLVLADEADSIHQLGPSFLRKKCNSVKDPQREVQLGA